MRPEQLQHLLAQGPVMRVCLTEVKGSAPRDSGTIMYVGAAGMLGTIGGGQLEYMAIDKARSLLLSGAQHGDMTVPLGPEIGQCCGGHVRLELRRLDDLAQERAALNHALETRPQVLIFGAGHIGRALARALHPLPCATMLIDSRAAELALAQDLPHCLTPLPEANLRAAPPGSSYVILTHDHALDFQLGVEAVAREDTAYIGMIGSATKAARFARFCRDQGQDPTRLTCPMGQKTTSKDPAVIAAMIVAELWPVVERQFDSASFSPFEHKAPRA